MKRLLSLIFVFIVFAMAKADNVSTSLYMFGFAANFSDSTVCFTTIQKVDSVYIDKKSKFLQERMNYSYQLRDMLKEKGWKAPTCITMYAPTREKAEKKYVKLKKRYSNGKYDIKQLSTTEFQFVAIEPTEITYVSSDGKTFTTGKKSKKQLKQERKAVKEEAKQAKKEIKQANKDAKQAKKQAKKKGNL